MTTLVEEERAAPASSPARLRRRRILPAVFLAYVAAAAFATWPLARFAGSRLAPNLGDPALNAWIFGWGAHGIIRQPFSIFSANMFHPDTLALAYSENVLGMSLPLAPVFWITGNAVLVENLAILLWLAIGGLGTFMLVRRLCRSTPSAFVAGLAVAVAPYRLSQIGHPHVVGAALAPLVVLALLRLDDPDADRRRSVLLLAGVLAGQFWASINGGVIALCAVAGWGVWMVARRRRAAWRSVRRAAVGVGLGVVVALPVVVPYALLRLEHPNYSHPVEEVRYFSASLGSYALPYSDNPIVGPLFRLWRDDFRTEGWDEEQLFPGLWLVAATGSALVAAAALATRRRVASPGGRGREGSGRLGPTFGLGAALALTGFVLSLGPRWRGEVDGFPLPFALAAGINGFIRVPARLGLLVPLGLAVCGGVSLARSRRRWRPWLVAASIALVVVEAAPGTLPTEPVPPITAAHRAVADRPGVVLALPTAEYNDDGDLLPETLARESIHLYLSTSNFRPLINGYGAYQSPTYYQVAADVAQFPSVHSLASLRKRNVHTVIVQTGLLAGTRWENVVERIANWPDVREVARGEGVIVYDVWLPDAASDSNSS